MSISVQTMASGAYVQSPSRSDQRHGEVGVLGERLRGGAAHVPDRGAAEGSDGSWNSRHAAGDVEHAPIEVESDDVFQMLPAAEQAAPVGDLGVAGYGADVGGAQG
jgi:hypothetical protein